MDGWMGVGSVTSLNDMYRGLVAALNSLAQQQNHL